MSDPYSQSRNALSQAQHAAKAGDFEIASRWAKEATKLAPRNPMAYLLLGDIELARSRFQVAVKFYREALRRKPDLIAAHGNLGLAWLRQAEYRKAAESFERVLRLHPGDATALLNLGNIAQAQGQLEHALRYYQQAIEADSNCAEAYNNAGALRFAEGAIDEARALLEQALQIAPEDLETLNNLGNVLRAAGKLSEAIHTYRKATTLYPEHAGSWNNLGNALLDYFEFEAGIAALRRAVQIKPDYAKARGNILFAFNFTASFSQSFCLEQAREYGRMVQQHAGARFTSWTCVAAPKRLRIGLVSGDFHSHPVAFFLENLLAQIDHSKIELFAYQNSQKNDAVTDRLKSHFAAWKVIDGKNDREAAQLIHDDGVHVLIDLSGHTAGNRLPVFAWKPAPVQVTWLGYFATTGVAEIDYLLADEAGVPENQRTQFTESVWYLPDTRLCFSPPDVNLPVAPLPALLNGHITFGCFQALAKVGDEVLAAWSKILMALPNARLRFANKLLHDSAIKAQFSERLKQHNIDLARVEFHGAVAREAYLAAHAEVDVILDTFPYPGGTTTCEALWMGVPTVTLAGDTLLSRQGASLLTAAGLGDWVCDSEEAYMAKAIDVASDLAQQARQRSELRQQVLVSSLCDAPRFARHFEEALWAIWRSKL